MLEVLRLLCASRRDRDSADADGISVFVPGSIGIGLLPIVPQLRFELWISVPLLVAILGASAITEAIGILDFLIGRLPRGGIGCLPAACLTVSSTS